VRISQAALNTADLSVRLEAASKEVFALKNPTYEQVFAYIDRNVGNAAADVERKLELKADIRYVDSALPMRLESLYRDMNVTLNEVRVEVGLTYIRFTSIRSHYLGTWTAPYL
jgi:hypothetical protein